MERKKDNVNDILKEARLSKYRLDEIKNLLKIGDITYAQAQDMARVPLNSLNKGMEIIAKEHGFKHKKVIFTFYMR